MISNIENCGDSMPQELKSNETGIFAQSCQKKVSSVSEKVSSLQTQYIEF